MQFVQNLVTDGSKHSKSSIVWEEAYTLGFSLHPDTVVNVWIEPSSVVTAVRKARKRTVVSVGWCALACRVDSSTL